MSSAKTSQYQIYDLDLDLLEKNQDPEDLPKTLGMLMTADNDFKVLPARQWIENFLYFGGMRDFYSRFVTGTVTGNSLASAFQNRNQSRRRHIPKTFKAVQIQAANVNRQRPSIKVYPESDEEQAERKAKLSNILLDYTWGEDREDDIYYAGILWALLTPLVARKDSLDFSFNKSRLWPIEEEYTEMINQPIIDPMTGIPARHPVTGQPLMQQIPQKGKRFKLDEQNNPLMEQLPWYKSELISAFRLIFNPSATWNNDLDYIGDTSCKRIGYMIQNYHRDEDGYYPENVEKLKKGNWNWTPIMGMESAMLNLSFGATRAYRNFSYGALPMKDGVVQAQFYIKPSPYYPEGREIVVANGLTMYDGKSRVYRELPKPAWHPYAFLTYERMPNRLWGTSYAEKLTDINRAYDQARGEFEQMRKTMSKPKLAIPIGSQIDRDTVTGTEEIWRYNPFGPGGGKPEFMSPMQPPSTTMDDLKLTNQEFVEASGVTEIMQGIRPQGVTTYRGLEVLKEEASNAANNLIRMYENFIQVSQFNKLTLMRKCMDRPDKNLTQALRVFKKMSNYVTDIDVKDFCNDDLAGFVVVEPYSTISKSRLAMQAKYESMAQMGALGDIVGDPDLNAEYKKKMDVTGFDAPKNQQVAFAKYENQLMLQADKNGAIINPPVLEWHDDPQHIKEVEKLLNDPTMYAPDKKPILDSLVQHRAAHMDKMARMMAQQMQAAMAQGGPAGGPQGQPQNGGGAPRGGVPAVSKPNEGTLFGPETGFNTNPEGSMA